MQRWFIILSFFICHTALGQIQTLSNCLQWFEKADKASVKASFQGEDFKLLEEKDSLDLKLMHYSAVKTTYGVQPHAYIFFNDSAVEYLSFEIYNQNEYKNLISQLKAQGFKSLGADVNGNYITTVYDNDRFLLCQDYEAVENPIGKGEIPHYGYRIYRKYGKFDELNGEKVVMVTVNGIDFENSKSYIGIRENYKNGILSGERTFYYPNGTVKRKENYQAGRLNGLVSDYNEEGKLTHSVTHSYHWKYGMEKWYDGEGKVVKTLQWQRDVPVGTEKYVINGKTIQGISYKNGLKQGSATIPVGINWVDGFGVDRFAIPIDLDWEQAWAVTKIKALETVTFANNIKTGKAVGISPFSSDTLYICYYKNGVIDSVFTAYQLTSFEISDENIPIAQTTFANGLENGTRTFWIRSGQYKDSVSYEENYINGKLNGPSTQFYSRSVNTKLDWFPYYVRVNFVNGILSGPYSQYEDSNNYEYGTYLNGKLDGKIEYSERTEQHWIKTTGHYEKGLKNGEWTTNSVPDSILITEQYERNEKVGTWMKKLNGLKVEERRYFMNQIRSLTYFQKNNPAAQYNLIKKGDTLFVKTEVWNGDSLSNFEYVFSVNDFPDTDTTLITIATAIQKNQGMQKYLNGKFYDETHDYMMSGNYRTGKLNNLIRITQYEPCITHELVYKNDTLISARYLDCSNDKPYSGKFISIVDGEQISVKNGLRHGWCIQYDHYKNEIKRTKYKEGVAKKTIASTKVLAKYTDF